VAAGRRLDWDGCCNVRDLGGLPTVDGGSTRLGAVVRADAIDRLSAAGWGALEVHGVRTVIDLRNDDELGSDVAPRPSGLSTLHLPLDNADDREFWDAWGTGPQFGTPLYYGPHLERFPQRSARVLAAIATAPPGGVLYHCGIGRDRTGMITILLLALAGVPPVEIAADYELSAAGVRELAARRGDTADVTVVEDFLRARGTTAGELVVSLLASTDVASLVRAGGLTDAHVTALRARLVG
jgi:protein tyrosine/serine phosphatase